MPAELFDDDIRTIKERHKYRNISDPICFYGSSSFRLWDRMVEDLGNASVVNCGFGGGTCEAGSHYLSEVIFPLSPQKIVLYFGENDIANEGLTSENAFAGYRCLAGLIKENQPFSRIYFLSVKLSPSRMPYSGLFLALNDLLREYCEDSEADIYIDGSTCLLGDNNLPAGRFFDDDLLHLNSRGYMRWAEVLRTVPDLLI